MSTTVSEQMRPPPFPESVSPPLEPSAKKARSGRFADEFVTCSWSLEGTVLCYWMELTPPAFPLYPSHDPTGKDNSFWFLCFDHHSARYLPGGFEQILDIAMLPNGWVQYGSIETAGYNFDVLSLSAGASFMIQPRQPTYQAVLF